MDLDDFILYHHNGQDIIFPYVRHFSMRYSTEPILSNIAIGSTVTIDFQMAEEQQKEIQQIKKYIKGASSNESDN